MSVAGPVRVDPDAALVEGLRRDDSSAMEQLVERYADRVYRLALRITGSREDAEEAAQDALWTAGRKITSLQSATLSSRWIRRFLCSE